jgi:hypothetical protein
VWVRIGGAWRRGRIIEWVRQIDRDGWDCVIMADEPASGPPWQGRYAFDPQSIRPRDTDPPPGLSRGDRRLGKAVMHVRGEFQSREGAGRFEEPGPDRDIHNRHQQVWTL